MNKVIRIGLVLYALGTIQNASSQVVYYIDSANNLRYLELSTCKDTLIMTVYNPTFAGDVASDFAVGPDGSFYVSFAFQDLYKADPVSGQMTYLTTFSNTAKGLVCDAQGVIWGGGYRLHSYDPSTNITIDYGNFDFSMAATVSGDLTFRNGNLYSIDAGKKIRKVDIQNPAQSVAVIDLSTSNLENIYGLFSIYYSCDSIVTYTTGRVGGEYKMAEVNFTTGAVSILNCIFPQNVEINGAATPLESLGSLPCVQEFSLDNNNSSGLTNGNYAGSLAVCPHDSLSIAEVGVVSLAPCPNSATGQLTVQPLTSGAQPFQFSLDGLLFQENTQFNDLPAGEQIVYVLDQNACVTEKKVVIPSLEPLVVVLEDAELFCAGGAINLEPVITGDQTDLFY